MGFGYYTSWGPQKGADEEKSALDLSAIAHRRWGGLDNFGALKVAASPLKTPFSFEGPFQCRAKGRMHSIPLVSGPSCFGPSNTGNDVGGERTDARAAK
jgi:hypothetical protein